MTSIGENYKAFLEQQAIKEFLVEGHIPTRPEIDARIEELDRINPGFQSPFTQPSIYKLSESESSSATKTNSTMLSVYNDLSIIYKSLVDQASTVTDTFDSVTSQLSLIKKRTAILQEKASNLLFMANNSEGGLDFVSDAFNNKDKIDDRLTDALVDTGAGVVTLSAKKFSRVSLELSSSDVQFNVLTRDDYLSDSLAPGSSLLNAFSDTNSIWSQRVKMKRGVGSVSCELILRLPVANTSINKIAISPSSSDEGNIQTVSIQYSTDGLNWLMPSGQSDGRLEGDLSLVFNNTTATYWKFIFNKAGYDEYANGNYTYEFGAKTIQLYGVEYSNKQSNLESLLVSNALLPESGKLFNKVSLSVCELVPSDCSIKYSIAGLSEAQLADYQSGTIDVGDLSFISIDPLERKTKASQSIIDFSKVDLETGHDSVVMLDSMVDFRYKDRSNLALDYTVPGSVLQDQIKILRNVGYNTYDNPILQMDRGWLFDGTSYSCKFYVAEESGRIIDLGNTMAFIDKSRVTGRVNLSKGYHSFETSKENWRKIDPTSISDLTNPDVLYPYNHKYLIEGIEDILYGDDLTVEVLGTAKRLIIDPDQVYQRIGTYWSRTLEKITIFDFVSNVDIKNYDVFSITKDSSGNDILVVKHNDEPGLMVDETFAIITRSVNGDLCKAVILKALLKTQDSKQTPMLDEYIIKLGY